MGVVFNWFKDYKIIKNIISYGFCEEIEYNIEYLNGDSTSHSYGNRTKLQNIFNKYLNVEIPTIHDYGYTENYYEKLELIYPSKMSKLCTTLLNNKDKCDLEDMEDRIIWIKELSDKGYYVSYDML